MQRVTTDRPVLLTAIHAEEEFDWHADFDRASTGVGHMREIDRLQDVFAATGTRATYLVGYPVATQDEAIRPLRRHLKAGSIEIGAHMHPWVAPPYDEAVNRRNSFHHNLPPALEREKLRQLTKAIQGSFGIRPRSYLGGRYSYGPNTGRILRELGYEIDLSINVTGDYSPEGGPDYTGYSNQYFWDPEAEGLLRLPGNGGYLGLLGPLAGAPLYRLIVRHGLQSTRLEGLLSQLGLFECIRLSPEGYTLAELKRLTNRLMKTGIRAFVFNFHSTSIVPGCTEYVRSADDLRAFLGRIDAYLRFFHEELGGVSMTASEFHQSVSGSAESVASDDRLPAAAAQ
ncbi:WalW protein [Oceanibacterium hippocampi]|uniref:WalW protein n=1 Tax=Oceanibacterium hippocampi TaxID=745714 RepID=UPI00111C4166|nr:WalW protein [Oceanibacterium hippocampi]